MNYIFIHGLGQKPSNWEQTLSGFTKRDQAICPDLTGFLEGRACTYTELYRAFSTYCDLIPEPFHLCGLSLGAVLALNYVIDHPERPESCVFIGAQYRMPKKLLTFQNVIFRFMPKSAFQNTGFQKNDMIRLTNSMRNLDFSTRLHEINHPVLVVCGEKDQANKKAAKYLAGEIRGANLSMIEGAGHEVNVDAPQKLAGMLNAFFDGEY